MSRIIVLAVAGYFAGIVAYALSDAPAYASDGYRLARYVIAPGMIALGLAACAFLLSRTARMYLALNAAAILGALFCFEAYMTWQLIQKSPGISQRVAGTSLAAERFVAGLPPAHTLKQLNRELGPNEPGEIMIGGVPGTDVYLCHKDGAEVAYTSDRYGFRNPDTVYDRPVDVLLLGDSFAEGICLPEGEHFAARLAAQGANVVNTGTRGAGPLFELAVLQRAGPALRPRITLFLVFGGNDWENLRASLSEPWLMAALDDAYLDQPLLPSPGRLQRAGDVIAGWHGADGASLRELLGRQRVVRNFFALTQTALTLGLHFPAAEQPIPEFEAALQRAQAATQAWGGSLVVAYLPPVDQFRGLMAFPGAHARLPGFVETAAGSIGAQYIDLSIHFRAHETPSALYARDSHLSALGAEVAASHILNVLAGSMSASLPLQAETGETQRP